MDRPVQYYSLCYKLEYIERVIKIIIGTFNVTSKMMILRQIRFSEEMLKISSGNILVMTPTMYWTLARTNREVSASLSEEETSRGIWPPTRLRRWSNSGSGNGATMFVTGPTCGRKQKFTGKTKNRAKPPK